MADTKENTISLEDNHDGQDEKNSEDEEEEVVVRTPKELYEALLKASRDGDEERFENGINNTSALGIM